MIMRSAGSEEDNLGLSPPRFCIGDLPRFPLALSVRLASMAGRLRGHSSIAALSIPRAGWLPPRRDAMRQSLPRP